MRVFVVSDVHIDYKENRDWLLNLSREEYVDDILVLAGDLTEDLGMLRESFVSLTKKFKKVLYVPGNHELWVVRDKTVHSFEKFNKISDLTDETGICMEPYHHESLSIVPMFGWYDFSFAEPTKMLLDTWMDFRLCRWPKGLDQQQVTDYFLEKNEPFLDVRNDTVISFSHFVPRIDLMPPYIPKTYRFVYPALGTDKLEEQVRRLEPDIHVYGHSHVNRHVTIAGIKYINNAFGYPSEHNISMKELLCVYED